jgi:hypothetical protein
VAYRGIGIMVFTSVLFDAFNVLAFSSGITRRSAYVSCASFTRVSELERKGKSVPQS